MEINLKKIVYFCLNSNHNDNKKDKSFGSCEENYYDDEIIIY